ncbi:MAG: DUF4339 domain-containing protein [Xanthomonadales bacterium]|nr:DUF4339 domain-containing protein [Xanthomonadaceae bacterium]MBN8225677.1 DUF4339 domain-containing protein [Xanthomonadales bacterium]
MTEWYYATADGRRHGPLPSAELQALVAAGTIGARTLVWREGQAQWRPLQDFAIELGLPALPPPLPATTPAAATQPPPRNLSGCAIAALVAAAGVFVVAVLGILAAIALPTYQDYTLRAQASAAIAEAQAHQADVVAFLEAHGRCPTNDDEAFGRATSHAGAHLASIEFGQFESSTLCGMAATIRAPGHEQLDGNTLWLEYNPAVDTWMCSSSVEDRYLPHSCRG